MAFCLSLSLESFLLESLAGGVINGEGVDESGLCPIEQQKQWVCSLNTNEFPDSFEVWGF